MRPSSRRKPLARILILAGDVDGNLGDHAILQATCAALRAVRPGLEISVVSDQPERCRQDFGARAVPRGPRGLASLALAAARSDLVLCGGGGLFQDDDSLVKMPYWAARVAFARLLAPRVVAYALGVGPLAAWTSRWSARLAFACMARVTVRDERARDVAQPLTAGRVEVVPDPALTLAPASREDARACLAAAGIVPDGRPLIGVAPRRWLPPRRRLVPRGARARLGLHAEAAGPEDSRLAAVLAGALDRLVSRHGARVIFLPTYRLAHEGDDAAAEAIGGAMRPGGHPVLRLDDASLYKAVCGELSLLIAARMHPAILAVPMGTPVLALAYNPKFDGFFALVAREEQVVPVTIAVRGDADELAVRAERAWRAGSVDAGRIRALEARFAAFNRELLVTT